MPIQVAEYQNHWRPTMVGIVKLALRRPYTFIVMALLIMIFGVASALRTPTDIFPNINIPVVSVVFSYTGLSPDDMAGRIVIFLRALTDHQRQRYRAYRISVHSQLRDHQDLFSAHSKHQRGARPGLGDVTNRIEADAARHHAATDLELQRLQ